MARQDFGRVSSLIYNDSQTSMTMITAQGCGHLPARSLHREQEAERQRREAAEKKRLAPIVKKLVADPRFVAPKISAAKHVTLAETLFADVDRATIKKAVEKAVAEIWLVEG